MAQPLLLCLYAFPPSVTSNVAQFGPPMLVDYGLSSTLRWFILQHSKRNNIPVDLQCMELSCRLPMETETAVFRIAQEALTNATKHAQPSNIRVLLEETDTEIRLIVRDDGKGFDPKSESDSQKRPGWGIRTMRERATNAGGTLVVDSRPGIGTEVRLEVRK